MKGTVLCKLLNAYEHNAWLCRIRIISAMVLPTSRDILRREELGGTQALGKFYFTFIYDLYIDLLRKDSLEISFIKKRMGG